MLFLAWQIFEYTLIFAFINLHHWFDVFAGELVAFYEINDRPSTSCSKIWSIDYVFLCLVYQQIFLEHLLQTARPNQWRRQWHPTPVLLPGKSYGWRSLVGCSPWGCEESDMTEQLPFHFSLSCIGEGNGNPLQCSCLENPRDGGALWAAVCGVAQSRTWLKQLSSSSSRPNLTPFYLACIRSVIWSLLKRRDI